MRIIHSVLTTVGNMFRLVLLLVLCAIAIIVLGVFRGASLRRD